jgi:Ca-activated chloride channel family protein
LPFDVAAALATARGIRVHTVGIGGEGEVAIESPAAGAPRGLRFERHDLDAATLRAIAAASGGRFFRARRPEDLEAVYAEIDALERALRPAPPERLATPRPEPLLALAGGLLLVEIASARVLARRLP